MKQPVNIYSKEAIKTRMLNNASVLWGLKNSKTLDPFVKLLIDAFSTEIFRVGNEINNIRTHMLEKISRLLTPPLYNLPKPAHAVALALPNESKCKLASNTEFFYKKRVTSTSKEISDIQVQMAFTPVGTVNLVQGHIAGLISAGNITFMDKNGNKMPVMSRSGQQLPSGEMWLPLLLSDEIETLDDLSLYCSFPGFEESDWVYNLLPFVQVSLNGEQLDVHSGLYYQEDEGAEGYEDLFREHSAVTKIAESIKNIYKRNFITLTGFPHKLNQHQSDVPAALTYLFDETTRENYFNEKYIWLKLQFPPQYVTDVLDNIQVHINAFPVFNRKWKQNECKFDVVGNNIPLNTGFAEHFLFVDSVVGHSGHRYSEIPYAQTSALNKGLYTIRVGGMERFDERNAIDLINYMLELTRDEVAAFSNLDRDNVATALQDMITQMKFLERKARLAKGYTHQVPSYLIVEPLTENETANAAYWVTNCELANNLRPGTVLNDEKNTLLETATVMLITTTTGGTEKQTGTDALHAYRYALTTRDRLVTAEDIKTYCKMELKNTLKQVSIVKGTAVSAKPKEGFIRTLDIMITPKNYDSFPEAYWQNKARTLLREIEYRAVDGINFRIFLKKEPETVH